MSVSPALPGWGRRLTASSKTKPNQTHTTEEWSCEGRCPSRVCVELWRCYHREGCFSPVTSSGDSVPKSFGKGKSLGGKSIGCAAPRASAKKDGNDPSMWVSWKITGMFLTEIQSTLLSQGWSSAWRTDSLGEIIFWDTWVLLFPSGS